MQYRNFTAAMMNMTMMMYMWTISMCMIFRAAISGQFSKRKPYLYTA